jgi:hypothetical protein
MLTFLRSKKDRADDAAGRMGLVGANGSLAFEKISIEVPSGEMDIADIAAQVEPRSDLTAEMNAWKTANMENINRGLVKILNAKDLEIPTFYGALWAKHIVKGGEQIDYSLVSLRVVTNAGVGYIVDAFQTSTGVELENMKYHGLGTGTNAEAAGDTALQTELTTEYNNGGNIRATGTTTESASNVYVTVATNTVDASAAITEHGIFSASSSGVLLDRSVFSVINLASGDSLQTTYSLTFTAGG